MPVEQQRQRRPTPTAQPPMPPLPLAQATNPSAEAPHLDAGCPEPSASPPATPQTIAECAEEWSPNVSARAPAVSPGRESPPELAEERDPLYQAEDPLPLDAGS